MKNKTVRLKEHHERVIFLNSVHHYTQSGNKKTAQYFRILKEIQRSIFIVNNYKPIKTNSFFNPIINPITQILCKR